MLKENRRGLSDLVSNTLIILLVFVSIAIMGVIILNLVKLSGSSIENSVACKQVSVKPVQCIHNITDANLLFSTQFESGVKIDSIETVATFKNGSSSMQSLLGTDFGNFETQSVRESRGDNDYSEFYTITKFKDNKGVERTCVSGKIGCELYNPDVEIVAPIVNPAGCGSAAKGDYPSSQDSWGTTSPQFCSDGSDPTTNPHPVFPSAAGKNVTWNCNSNPQNCTARRLLPNQQSGGGGGGGGADLPDSTVCSPACGAGKECRNGNCVDVCVPTTCAAQSKNCGAISNGCGGTLDCGLCGAGQTCGTDNICHEPSLTGCYGTPTNSLCTQFISSVSCGQNGNYSGQCSWVAGDYSCTGRPECSNFAEQDCDSSQKGNSPLCDWNSQLGQCQANTDTCESLSNFEICNAPGCTWQQQSSNKCEGTLTCNGQTSAQSCSAINGCSWLTSGVNYNVILNIISNRNAGIAIDYNNPQSHACPAGTSCNYTIPSGTKINFLKVYDQSSQNVLSWVNCTVDSSNPNKCSLTVNRNVTVIAKLVSGV